MNCPKCNAPVPENSLFCPECGAKVEAPAPAAASFCESCGAALAPGALFCENCGSKVGAAPSSEVAPVTPAEEIPVASAPEQPATNIFCPECGAAMEPDALFCEHCGAKIQEAPQPAQPEAAPKANPLKKCNIPPKFLKLGLIGLAAVVVIIVAVCLIVNLTAKQDYALYIKDGEMVYSPLSDGNDLMEITSDLNGAQHGSALGYQVSSRMDLSEDGKTLFFPDKLVWGSLGGYDGMAIQDYSLYYIDISDPDSEAERIASGISSHVVNKKGTLVTYLKDNTLYQSDLKDDEKIASNVTSSNYFVSKDGNTILYLSTKDGQYTGSLYVVKNGEDPNKIASDVSRIVYVNDKFDTFLYLKECALYRANSNGDHEKLLNDAGNLVHVYGADSIYYYVFEESEIAYWDLIENDIKEATYKSHNIEDVSNYLKNIKMHRSSNKLYYFDGNDSVLVSENYDSFVSTSFTEAQTVYCEIPAEPPKVKLSEVLDIYDSFYYYYEDAVEEALANAEQNQAGTIKFAVKGNAYVLDVKGIFDVVFADDGKTAYVFADYDSEPNYATYNCNVYKVSVSDSGLGEMTLLDEDVSSTYHLMQGGRLIYFKDMDDMVGELHIDGKMVDNNVYITSVIYSSETDSYAFLADYSGNKLEGTLMEYKDGKLTEVKDKVSDMAYSPCGNLLFLYDYNRSNREGELWIQDGRKCSQLDEDVNAIIRFP